MEVVDVKGLELLSLAGVLGCSGNRPLLASNSSSFRLFLSSAGSDFLFAFSFVLTTSVS